MDDQKDWVQGFLTRMADLNSFERNLLNEKIRQPLLSG